MNALADWQDEYERMRTQIIGAMRPTERAHFAVAAAAHRDALARPFPTARLTAESVRLAAEFSWLFEAAVALQAAEQS